MVLPIPQTHLSYKETLGDTGLNNPRHHMTFCWGDKSDSMNTNHCREHSNNNVMQKSVVPTTNSFSSEEIPLQH